MCVATNAARVELQDLFESDYETGRSSLLCCEKTTSGLSQRSRLEPY